MQQKLEISTLELKQLRSFKAIVSGEACEKDTAVYNEIENEIKRLRGLI